MGIQYKDSKNFYYSAPWRNLSRWVRGRLKNKIHFQKCVKCSGPFECLDHVVPIKKDKFMSLEPSNLQPMCFKCNKEKLNKTIDYRCDELREFMYSLSRRGFTKELQLGERKLKNMLKNRKYWHRKTGKCKTIYVKKKSK